MPFIIGGHMPFASAPGEKVPHCKKIKKILPVAVRAKPRPDWLCAALILFGLKKSDTQAFFSLV
ncbi:MAG: hypothetical protein UC390_06260 [Peptococcaceae bacterium]|nr:hypothetical protein [Peptococcaceae bacterium]